VSATEAFFASRSMQALEVLAFGPSTATQVADELQVHPRTARRLLNRMVHDGWLIRRDGPRPTYTPTMRIVALAAQLAQRAPLVRLAHELAADLHARTGEAVHLAVPSYRSALRLVRATGRPGGATWRPRTRSPPASCSSPSGTHGARSCWPPLRCPP
jgi:DNA-binding IclR family transcriptional regulator